jgi:Flp pilus assembly pilin Flp
MLMRTWKSFWIDEAGVEAIEYGLIMGAMALVILPAMAMLTGNLGNWGTQISTEILSFK